jgi:hypothetical protein
VVIDPDVFAVGDISELLSRDMQGKALRCVARLGHNGEPDYLASSVMLLDCTSLTHWQCEEQFHEMFAVKRDYTAWVSLALEPREHIGLLEPEWNHFDTLNEKTKLLHTTKRRTQPWKTGLSKDYTVRDHGWRSQVKAVLQHVKGWVWGEAAAKGYYQRHPDPKQEAFFFGLLRECLEQGIVTEELLREEMRQNHLRHDALAVLEHTPALAA